MLCDAHRHLYPVLQTIVHLLERGTLRHQRIHPALGLGYRRLLSRILACQSDNIRVTGHYPRASNTLGWLWRKPSNGNCLQLRSSRQSTVLPFRLLLLRMLQMLLQGQLLLPLLG